MKQGHPLRRLERSLFIDFPRAIRRNLRLLLMITIVFVGIIIIGFAIGLMEDGLIIGGIQKQIESEIGWLEEEGASASDPFGLTAVILRNNLANIMLTIGVGIGFGILTLSMFAINALVIGYVGTMSTLPPVQTIALFFPHGLIELTAYIIAVTCGIRLGIGSARSVSNRMTDPLRAAGSDVGDLLPGVILLLIVSGFVEGFLAWATGPLLDYLKIMLGLMLFLIIFLWCSGSLIRD